MHDHEKEEGGAGAEPERLELPRHAHLPSAMEPAEQAADPFVDVHLCHSPTK